jgi:hypothetical protein
MFAAPVKLVPVSLKSVAVMRWTVPVRSLVETAPLELALVLALAVPPPPLLLLAFEAPVPRGAQKPASGAHMLVRIG